MDALKPRSTVTDMALPLTPEEITPDWLTAALSFQYPGVQVRSFVTRDVLHGASTKFRIEPEYDTRGKTEGLPRLVIVKGGFEEHSPAAENAHMYLLEMMYYREIAPLLNMRSPKCYYAGRDPDSHQAIVILEDLAERDVSFFNAYRTQTYAQVAKRLDAMAKYHAQTWGSSEFAPEGRFSWIPSRYRSSPYIERAEYLLSPDVWNTFMRMPRGAALPRPLRDAGRLRHALQAMARAHDYATLCLIHGDTHLGNVYEEPDGTPGFFDPQLARAPWSMEVAYHLVGALEVEDRRRWERPLVEHYLCALRTNGIEPPAFEDAWDAYCRDICHGLYIWATNEGVFQEEPINTANAARFGAAAMDCGTLSQLAPSGYGDS